MYHPKAFNSTLIDMNLGRLNPLNCACMYYRDRKMTYRTLSTLNDEDLEILGVQDANVRQRMLINFGERHRKVSTFEQ